MLRPCLLKAGKFEMDYQNVSNGICQKTSSIKETLDSFKVFSHESYQYNEEVKLILRYFFWLTKEFKQKKSSYVTISEISRN